jgi:cation diffusion facilitator family transporter
MLILLVGFELIKSSVETLIAKEAAPKYPVLVYVVLGISVAVKLWLFIFNRKLGKKLSSDALFATSQDSRNDAIATVVIILSAICSRFTPSYINLDAIMGLLVGLFIIYSGIGAAKETVDKLLGQPPEEEMVNELEKTILSFSDFSAIHDLIIHNYGPGRCLASVHVEVSQNIDIVHCHEQVDLCEKLVGEKLGILLTIHSDPIDIDNDEVSEIRTALSEKVKTIHESVTIHDFRMTPIADERTNLIFDAVLPNSLQIEEKEFKEKINELAREINPTFVCVITVDRNYI